MGRDNQAKERQLRRTAARDARRACYARILIVTEGSKTEPLYLQEIRIAHQLHSASVEVQPGRLGTAPIQVVRYAQQLFEEGDLHKGIRPKSFEQVYAVFDWDDHDSYFNALNLAKSFDGKLRNDDKLPVSFKADDQALMLSGRSGLGPIHRLNPALRINPEAPPKPAPKPPPNPSPPPNPAAPAH